MSSATSTEPQPLQPWQFFTLAGLMGATIVVFLSEGQSPAAIIVLSFVIFGGAAVGVATWRMCSPLAGADAPAGPQIFGGRTRAALEREKSLVLRSIKDLEFDHAMGKVSDKDFAEMGARLRGRAAGLLRQLDAGSGYREAIQMELDKRLGKRSSSARTISGPREKPTPSVGEPDPTSPQASSGQAKVLPTEGEKPTAKICLSCCTQNDPDARFCKGCGYQMGDW
jgi:ribosomal protein L40E